MSKLPKGWDEKLFNEFFNTLQKRKGLQRNQYKESGSYPIVDQGQNLISGYSNESALLIKSNDGPYIIFGDHTRNIKYIDFDFIVGADGTKLLISKEAILPKFAYYHLLNIKIPSTGYNRHFRFLKDFKFYLPPTKQHQQLIVKVLDHAHKIIKEREAAIKLCEQLIEAAFYEMFGDPVRNEKGWEKAPLHKLGTIVTGTTPLKKYDNSFGGDIPFITPGDLENNMENPARTLTNEGALRSRRVRAGSTMVCCIGTIGKVDKAVNDSCFNQQINAIEWFDNDFDIFGMYLMKYNKELLISRASKAVVPILNKTEFSKIEVIKPSKLINKFNDIAQKNLIFKESLQEALTLEKQQFQALLQAAFEGKLTAHLDGEDE